MRAWKELTSLALQGTGKAEANPEPERHLLDEAAWHTLRKLAGHQPARIARISEAETEAPLETRPYVPPPAATRLEEILRTDDHEHLGEWLSIAASVHKLVPPSLLPALLERGEEQSQLRSTILEVGGHRVLWLAAQNEEWAFAAIADPPEAFKSGIRTARVAALAELRRQDPAAALATLIQGWAQEGGDDRTALLPELEIGLGPGDEDFLTRATTDGRKEVRNTATDLLARLPTSALIARMTSRADAWIRFRRGVLGGKLEVTPPAECDADMIADGIEPKAPKGIGERAHWMRQVLARVPPTHWAPECLEASTKSEWREALLMGWIEATVRFGDTRWCVMLLEHYVPRRDQGNLAVSFQNLVRSAPLPAIEAAILDQLKRAPAYAILIATARTDRLSATVSGPLMRALELEFTKQDKQQREQWLSAQTRQLRASLDPSVLPDAIAFADRATQAGATLAGAGLQSLTVSLEYRAEMAKEILS
jgi:hypothetical protein